MLSEEKRELMNRAIGYRECMLDIMYSGLLTVNQLDKIFKMCDIRYKLDEVMEDAK